MKKLITIFFLVLVLNVSAQDKIEITEDDYGNTDVEMADTMRQNGKIYVVVGVIAIIIGGMFTYMILTDRKISQLEKEIES